MAGQECGKDQAELWYGGTIAFPSEHKTKLVRNRSVPFRSVPSPSEHGLRMMNVIQAAVFPAALLVVEGAAFMKSTDFSHISKNSLIE